MTSTFPLTLTGVVVNPPEVRDLRNRSGVWAKARVAVPLPPRTDEDGTLVTGRHRYFTVKLFGQAATAFAEATNDGQIRIGTPMQFLVNDIRPNAWTKKDGSAAATLDAIAEAFKILPPRGSAERAEHDAATDAERAAENQVLTGVAA